MNEKVKRYLEKQPAAKRKLMDKLRAVVLSADPRLEEDLKWGAPAFLVAGRKIAFIYTYVGKDYVNFGYFKAARLTDPDGLLEGTGKGMRHVKIRSAGDIDAARIRAWTKEAVRLESE